MSVDPTTAITELGLEPTYSAREATAFFPRSYSWFDQRLRAGHFLLPDGTPVRPGRTPGGYRRFSLAMLRDVAVSCTNEGWFSLDDLRFTVRELLIAAHRDTGEYKIPN